MKYADIKHVYLVRNTKTHEEQSCICDTMDTAVIMAVVLNGWRIDDCIATEIEEYLEDGEYCALTPYGE